MGENKSSSLKKGPKDPPLSPHHWGRRLNRTFSGLYLNEKKYFENSRKTQMVTTEAVYIQVKQLFSYV